MVIPDFRKCQEHIYLVHRYGCEFFNYFIIVDRFILLGQHNSDINWIINKGTLCHAHREHKISLSLLREIINNPDADLMHLFFKQRVKKFSEFLTVLVYSR